MALLSQRFNFQYLNWSLRRFKSLQVNNVAYIRYRCMGTLAHEIPDGTTVGLIGCGKMGEAILNGLISSGAVPASNISVSRRSVDHLSQLKARGAFCTTNNVAVAERSKVLIIAVKGYTFPEVFKEIEGNITNDKVVVSVAAGVKINKLEQMLPTNTRVVRVLPNTPCLVGAGAACYSVGLHATKEDGNLVKALFSTTGICDEVPEKQINAVIGVAGSAVAYMFMSLSSMADGGVKLGLSRETAQNYVAHAMLGAAKMAIDTKLHPEILKDNVCSPGGATIAAVHCLEEKGLRDALMSAVEAASTTANRLDEESE